MKTQKEYQEIAKSESIANGGRSVGVLLELAKERLTMNDRTHLPRIARLFCTTIDNVYKCAERHADLLQHVKDQAREIQDLKMQISALKAQKAQGIEANCARQPWEMTTDEFKACLKLEWKDPFADECVGFGSTKTDTPLCELPNK